MNSPWKLILLLTGIFLAGTVTGGFVTKCHIRKEISKRVAPEKFCESRLEMLTKRLALTADQQEKLKPIMHRNKEDLVRIRNSTVAETRRIIDQMERDIAGVLTPEQRVKFEELSREKREKINRYLKGKISGLMDEWRGSEDCPSGASTAKSMPEKPASGT